MKKVYGMKIENEVCTKCGGTGTVSRTVNNGTGSVKVHSDCSKCDGVGGVYK